MSYIRELRPYMYWLGYLSDRKGAGELDWQSIGGTWGSATSNLLHWQPPARAELPYPGFEQLTSAIARRSEVLSRYVVRYFCDMREHTRGLYRTLKRGGRAHYVVGNNKFYDVLLPAHEIFAALFEAAGFADVQIDRLRKRTSKAELFEYLVTARKLKPNG